VEVGESVGDLPRGFIAEDSGWAFLPAHALFGGGDAEVKRRAHDLPSGAARLTTSAIGLHGVWINGVKAADEMGFCADPASRPGNVLRSFAS
jgi:hypothetical protein